jgi:hypothetical protein
MSIQKKSLVSALKTTKKANVASAPTTEVVQGEKHASMRGVSNKSLKGIKNSSFKGVKNSSFAVRNWQ